MWSRNLAASDRPAPRFAAWSCACVLGRTRRCVLCESVFLQPGAAPVYACCMFRSVAVLLYSAKSEVGLGMSCRMTIPFKGGTVARTTREMDPCCECRDSASCGLLTDGLCWTRRSVTLWAKTSSSGHQVHATRGSRTSRSWPIFSSPTRRADKGTVQGYRASTVRLLPPPWASVAAPTTAGPPPMSHPAVRPEACQRALLATALLLSLGC